MTGRKPTRQVKTDDWVKYIKWDKHWEFTIGLSSDEFFGDLKIYLGGLNI